MYVRACIRLLSEEEEPTNDGNIGENWQSASPRDSTEVCPLLIHFPWRTGQELIQYLEDDESDNLRNDPS